MMVDSLLEQAYPSRYVNTTIVHEVEPGSDEHLGDLMKIAAKTNAAIVFHVENEQLAGIERARRVAPSETVFELGFAGVVENDTIHRGLCLLAEGSGPVAVDGHTASLFSDQHIESGCGKCAVGVVGPDQLQRISLTAEVIRRAERIIFVVFFIWRGDPFL